MSEMRDKGGRHSGLDRIFNPESVAVIGVSANGLGFGSGIFRSLQAIGFNGRLYPVNSRGGALDGLTIYPSIEDIPGKVDFAIIAVPAKGVPQAIEACQRKGVAGVEILSAGFGETNEPDGLELDRQIKRIVDMGIRVIGPNCFGIYAPGPGLTLLPGPDLPRETGPVAFISQSGGHAVDIAHVGRWKGIRFSKVVSFGNGIDLRETELLEYFSDDPMTQIIGMYIEGVIEGRHFFRALKEASGRKPVIVCKGGLSEAGSRAVASHTGSMGGSGVIWESALRQCNAVRVDDIGELADACLAFTMLPLRRYRGIAMIGGGGALGVASADMAERSGMYLPRLKEDVRARIEQLLPKPGSSAANPVDVANPFVAPSVLKEVMILASQDESVDVLIMVQLLYHYKSVLKSLGASSVKEIIPAKDLARSAKEAAEAAGKPVVLVMPNQKREIEALDIEEAMRECRQLFIDNGIPVYDDIRSAIVSIARVSEYCSRKDVRGH